MKNLTRNKKYNIFLFLFLISCTPTPIVVGINNTTSYANGIVLQGEEGLLITKHIVDSNRLKVDTFTNKYWAKVKKQSSSSDLALLDINFKDETLPLCNSIGTEDITIYRYEYFPEIPYEREVYGRVVGPTTVEASIGGGFSGAPVVSNNRNCIIGIVTGITASGYVRIATTKEIKNFLKDL
jgi:hypothetical protein